MCEDKESVLYDVLVYHEWQGEEDLQGEERSQNGAAVAGQEVVGKRGWNPLARRDVAKEEHEELLALGQAWQMAVSPDGASVVVSFSMMSTDDISMKMTMEFVEVHHSSITLQGSFELT